MINVLVVDDDNDLLEMVTFALNANEMTVSSLSEGQHVLETVLARPPDVLLMDIFLGDSDGRQLCKQIKSTAAYMGFPILLYSAGEISNASIVESSADFFLRKPFDLQRLIAAIRQYIKN